MSEDRRWMGPGAIAVLLFVSAAVIALPLWLWWSASRSSAAFGDSEILDGNRLGAATLDIEVGRRTAGFRAENLAPGDRVSGQLEVTNVGTLPLRYQVDAVTDGGPLADWLRFDVWTTTEVCRPGAAERFLASGVRLSAAPTVLVGALPGVVTERASGSDEELRLAPGGAVTVCLGARLPLEAPNEIQGQRLDVELMIRAEHDLDVER